MDLGGILTCLACWNNRLVGVTLQEVFPPYSEKPEFIFKPSWDIRQELPSLHGCSMFLGLELTILSQKVGMRLEQVFCHSPRDGRLKDRPRIISMKFLKVVFHTPGFIRQYSYLMHVFLKIYTLKNLQHG